MTTTKTTKFEELAGVNAQSIVSQVNIDIAAENIDQNNQSIVNNSSF